jgi:hypothetical protein
MTVTMVHTIKSYIPQAILDGKVECRITINNGDKYGKRMLGM